MALSEKELLLLSCIVYSTGITQTNDPNMTLGELSLNLADMDSSVLRNTLSGGFGDINHNRDSRLPDCHFFNGPEEYKALLREVINSPTLSALDVRYPHDDNSMAYGFCGACFVDVSGDATVVFKGTNNLCHTWNTGTNPHSQSVAVDYINKVSANYSNLTVTGHAKGGNQAMLATVLCGEQVNRCISFNGQSFNKNFCKQFKDQILANKHKIKTFNAHNDPVSQLYDPLTDEVRYVAHNGKEPDNSAIGYYASYLYWDNNYDQNGAIISERERTTSPYPVYMYMNSLPPEMAADDEASLIDGFLGWLKKKSHYQSAPARYAMQYEARVQLDSDQLRDYADQLRRVGRRVGKVRDELTFLCEAYPKGELLLKILNNNFNIDYENGLNKCIVYLDETANAFDRAEYEINRQFSATERNV